MNKVREENIPVINYTGEVKDGDVSDNQDVQRYFCSDKPFVNGIGVTVLTGDYLPPLIITLAVAPLAQTAIAYSPVPYIPPCATILPFPLTVTVPLVT